jgi:hypothetical protein
MATKKAPAKNPPAKNTAVKNITAMPSEALGFVGEVVTTSLGIPFVIQSRIGALPRIDLTAVATFLDEAKRQGAVRLVAAQQRIEPVAKRVRDLVAA